MQILDVSESAQVDDFCAGEGLPKGEPRKVRGVTPSPFGPLPAKSGGPAAQRSYAVGVVTRPQFGAPAR